MNRKLRNVVKKLSRFTTQTRRVSLSTMSTPPSIPSIPLVLLKTRSQPHDAYEEYFSSSSDTQATSSPSFHPICVPVLEHRQNTQALQELRILLKSGRLNEKYGGMIFTSQRAVEVWADVVKQVQQNMSLDGSGEGDQMSGVKNEPSSTRIEIEPSNQKGASEQFTSDIVASTPFPLYVVGPATARLLSATIIPPPHVSSPSPFGIKLYTTTSQIVGSHTGNGQTLAHYMLHHYNSLHADKIFTYYEAPRLPFIPLLGMSSQNYSRKRLERDDPRLQKKPLLFLVGETRRDIIPKTLMDESLKGTAQNGEDVVEGDRRIEVEEVEVYATDVKSGFKDAFETQMTQLRQQQNTNENNAIAGGVIAIVVFSPQGSSDLLKSLDFLDETSGKAKPDTAKSQSRWPSSTTSSDRATTPKLNNENPKGTRYVIVTIGPTTYDHLRDTFGFEADVCAKKPSPEGVEEGIDEFLRDKGIVVGAGS